MGPGARAGFVATNPVSQGRARKASLNDVVAHGGVITDAVSRQKWPGEAVVNVSIVNWVQKPSIPPKRFELDGVAVVGISTRLQESKLAVEEYEPLAANLRRAFQGPIPGRDFYLRDGEAAAILALTDAEYAGVICPYLIGDDLTDDPQQGPRRWVIDFGVHELDEASFPLCSGDHGGPLRRRPGHESELRRELLAAPLAADPVEPRGSAAEP